MAVPLAKMAAMEADSVSPAPTKLASKRLETFAS